MKLMIIDKNEIACVLTDNNLIIQTFTANCVELLGLNSNIIIIFTKLKLIKLEANKILINLNLKRISY